MLSRPGSITTPTVYPYRRDSPMTDGFLPRPLLLSWFPSRSIPTEMSSSTSLLAVATLRLQESEICNRESGPRSRTVLRITRRFRAALSM